MNRQDKLVREKATDNGRLARLQGLRALAFIAVFLYHLDVVGGVGFLGVDVFFVISGFILTRIFLIRPSFAPADFLMRRLLRLSPALAVVVAFVVIVQATLGRPFSAWHDETRTALASLIFTSNIFLEQRGYDYFGVVAEQNS